MTKCQSVSRRIDHSDPERDPEMFAVSNGARERVMCLAHAVEAEDRGYAVRLILT